MRNQVVEPQQAPPQPVVPPPELAVQQQPRVRKDLGVEGGRAGRAEEPLVGAEERGEGLEGGRRVGEELLGEDQGGARGLEDLGRGGGVEGLVERVGEQRGGGEVETAEEGLVLGV